MEILEAGHKYKVNNFSKTDECDTTQEIVFVKDAIINGDGHEGTNCQELLRVLIDRVKFLESQKSNEVNEQIIKNLRECIILFEKRHLDRLFEKNVDIESIETFKEGHFTKIIK